MRQLRALLVGAGLRSGLAQQLEAVRTAIPPSSGSIATYIPQLAKADPNSFGAALCSVNGDVRALVASQFTKNTKYQQSSAAE